MALTSMVKRAFLVGLLFLSFLTLNIPTTSAHVGTITSLGTDNPPTLDGTIDSAEWSDANLYHVSEGNYLYLKHDENYIYIGIRVRDNEQSGEDHLDIYFDEGDDGGFGSGSHDGVLKDNQDDWKGIRCSGPVIYTYANGQTEEFFREGYLLDGAPRSLWGASSHEVDFDAGFAFHTDHWDLELRIPFRGTENRIYHDHSDLMITTLDVVGVWVGFWDCDYYGAGHIVFRYPDYSSDDPTKWLDLEFDSDGDGLSDLEEDNLGTSLYNPDTDNDGLKDGDEVKIYSTDPLKIDTDADNLPDNLEILTYGTNPLKRDTDNDDLLDSEELFTYNTNPLEPDSDNDGLNDGKEVEVATNPLNPDTDGDGLKDGKELDVYGSNPLASDSDGDGVDDHTEVRVLGTNPLKVDTDGDFWSDSIDPWPTNVILPNILIISLVITGVVAIIWWRRRR